MPECLPFCGWFYNLEKVKPEEVLAPPYDVVTKEEIEYYKKKSPYNIFHLELSESPSKAKELLEKFISEKIFLQERVPTLYYHELEFEYQGKRYLRRGFILLVKLHPFEEKIILPHERVYNKVTEERLNLLKATSFQFSQVYALYEDPYLFTLKELPENLNFFLEVTFGTETQRLAKIQERSVIEKILSFLKPKRFYIADGHHRYNTALKYKAYMESLYGQEEFKDYNYISMYISPFEDENLLMLPTHRVFKNLDGKSFLERLKQYVIIEKESPILNSQESFEALETAQGDFFLAFEKKLYFCRLREEIKKVLKEKEAELSELPLWNFLQIFEEIVGVPEEKLKEEERVEFFSRQEEVLKRASQGGLGVLFPTVSAEILKRIAEKEKVMPHKSTYFYPKILTGLVLAEVSGKRIK